MQPDQLVSQSYEFIYTDETYLIEIVDTTTSRWTRTVGNPIGSTDVEVYVWSDIGDGRWLITWTEATGLGLSSLMDVKAGVLTTHTNNGREVFVNAGSVRWRD